MLVSSHKETLTNSTSTCSMHKTYERFRHIQLTTSLISF